MSGCNQIKTNSLKVRLSMLALPLMFAVIGGCASNDNEEPVYIPRINEPTQSIPSQSRPQIEADQCRAQSLQYLVGRSRTEIPIPLDPSSRRVVCSTCVMTQDYNAARQTIIFDVQSGRITSVKCG